MFGNLWELNPPAVNIHNSPKNLKFILAITGGGTEVVGELLKYGGGSKTVLEVSVPYCQKSFDVFLKGKPDKYASPEAARDLAVASFQRAIQYEGIENAKNLLGVGVTCVLGKDNERANREHHIYLCVQSAYKTHDFHVNLTKIKYLNMHRVYEEQFVSNFVLYVLSKYFDVEENIFEYLPEFKLTEGLITESFVESKEYWEVVSGQKKVIGEENFSNRLVFPGSFHPIHDAHRMIIDEASEIVGKKVDLEICVKNVDKPHLNYHEISRRESELKKEPNIGNIFFTCLPTFLSKAEVFVDSTFIVGYDTLLRIGDPKYANLDDVILTFRKNNITLLVFRRMINGQIDYNDSQIYKPLMEFVNFVESVVPPEMSSSKIRNS